MGMKGFGARILKRIWPCKTVGGKTAPVQMHGAAKDSVVMVRIGGYDYLEQTIKRMVEELKRRGCLDKDFVFLTKAEQEAAVEQYIDQFLKNH